MKLQNILHHMRNASVKVNGTRYDLDADGVVDVGSDSDAKKLLGNRSAWRRYYPQVEELATLTPKEPALPTNTTHTKIILPPDSVDDRDVYKVKEDTSSESMLEDAYNGDGTELDLDEKYPDPTMENTLAELKKTAKAYQVKISDQPNKEELIKRIMAAMYPNEE